MHFSTSSNLPGAFDFSATHAIDTVVHIDCCAHVFRDDIQPVPNSVRGLTSANVKMAVLLGHGYELGSRVLHHKTVTARPSEARKRLEEKAFEPPSTMARPRTKVLTTVTTTERAQSLFGSGHTAAPQAHIHLD